MRMLLLTLFISTSSFASSIIHTNQNAPNLISIEVPFEARKPKRSLKYGYSIIKPREYTESPTTVVWLGGGPEAALAVHQGLVADMFPPKVQVLLVDYRGFGVNKPTGPEGPNTDVPEFVNNSYKEFNSDTITSDIIRVLKKENIEDYILFGQSFGTIIATKIAALATKNGLKAPKKVVLEGSIAGSPSVAEAKATARLFNDLLRSLSPEARNVLYQDQSYGFTRAEWDMLFRYFVLANGGQFAVETLNNTIPYFLGSPAQIAAGKAYLDPLIIGAKEALGESYKEGEEENESPKELAKVAQKKIASKILLSEIRYDSAEFVLKNGLYSVEQNQFDEHFIEHFNPFDSSAWSISSPIIYIHGELDTATYLETGRSHARSQKQSLARYFFTVPNAGHSPISLLDSKGKYRFWNSVIFGNSIDANTFPHSELETIAPEKLCNDVLIKK